MSLDDKVQIIKNAAGQELVQMDVDVFEAIRSYIEDQGLLEAMLENKNGEKLDKEDALDFYSKLKKEN